MTPHTSTQTAPVPKAGSIVEGDIKHATIESDDNTPAPPSQHQYFTRSKRKRDDDDDGDDADERLHKTMKALIARVKAGENVDEAIERAYAVFEAAYPSKEVNGIRIPETYETAINDHQYGTEWKRAIVEELSTLMTNGTWKEVIKPSDINMVSTKWVFDVKVHNDGSIERFKARLVARGFSQVQGKDFQETFAPTVRMDTLRQFLAVVAKEDKECRHYDIKNAFTEAHLKEDIYFSKPKGVEVRKGYVLTAL